MAIVENGNGGGLGVGVDLGRRTPTPLENPDADSADKRRDHHRQGRVQHPSPALLMSSMDPTQVRLPQDGARHAFFMNFVQNKGRLQEQVQFQRQDQNLRVVLGKNGGGDHGDERDISELQDLFSNLNPLAEEFVPPSLANGNGSNGFAGTIHGSGSGNGNGFTGLNGEGNGLLNGVAFRRKNHAQGRRRINNRTSMAQREEIIQRTVYVSDIDQQVTEEQLAALFVNCGQVVDCRICGDPNSVLRFAFIEFTDEESARAALNLSGTMLGFYPVRVLPSKTAIAPVNPTFLPRNEDEREMCTRTIYCTNIDKKVTQSDVKLFFESVCGEVYRLRLLGDYHHSTRIAFVEFVMAESAIAALNCSGVVLGSLPIRVSPSKTPVRPRAPRMTMH
ncbi:hypothetical protein MLD38_019143 [Melastoma candidum]|uniref:Uncharacterized protein n=1 Tax=Melastoma candidum TaxID=119954 RepID=A0ACB9QW23_9MYRT|nr:hypothetical protein MLD38_019143 [Melastoma candidum]